MTTLKIKYLVRVEYVDEPTLEGLTRKVARRVGPVHMAEAVLMGKTVTIGPLTLCGLTQSELGFYNSDVLDQRPNGLPLCPKCEEQWKRHPASPWRDWLGVSVLALFFLLGCLSPTAALPLVEPTATESARMATPTEGRPAREGARCMVVRAESLHVRDLPGYEVGQVVGYLFGGQVVRVFDWQEDGNGTRWYQVREGWSSGAWMEAAECP